MKKNLPSPIYKMAQMLSFIVLLFFWGSVKAQGTKADYQRADTIFENASEKIYNAPENFNWSEEGDQFWYFKKTRGGGRYMLVDVSKKEKKELFDHKRFADVLEAESNNTVDSNELPISSLKYNRAEEELRFNAFNEVWLLKLKDYKLEKVGDESMHQNEHGSGYWGDPYREKNGETVSPDSLWVAYIKNYNVYVRKNNENNNEEEVQVSFDGGLAQYYSDRIYWSPDSKSLVSLKITPNEERKIYFVESSPESQLQPILHNRHYLKPGDALPQSQPVLFDVETKKSYAVNSDTLPNQYSVGHVAWKEDSQAYTFEYNQRGHQLYQVFSVDRESGELTALITEKSKTFIDYSGKKYRKDIDDGKEIIWASERDGWNHLYLYDGLTGKVKNQITKGDWVVRKVVHIDEEERFIIFAGSGKVKGQDPYLIQYYKVNFDGSDLTALTKENGNHKATFSPDYTTFVDTYSRVDSPPITVVKNSDDGKILMDVEEADIEDLLETGWTYPEVFNAKGRDGVTDIWGVIIRPSNFDSSKDYPIIESIYAGPTGSFVPKDFGVYSGFYKLAELGFIVVQIDGMGTSNRSKAFHDITWKNLKDGGFPDRILWMKSAAQKYAYIDLDQVGIYGTSAGGQNAAAAVLFYPEFYKAAVSASGVHDNRMDKLWWNEQWMGYPVGPQYTENSNTVHADQLQGRLMLIAGEMDDNVDPATTMQMADALIKAKKDFELVIIPGAGHTSGEEFGERKRRDFFVKYLLGTNPPIWENQEEH